MNQLQVQVQLPYDDGAGRPNKVFDRSLRCAPLSRSHSITVFQIVPPFNSTQLNSTQLNSTQLNSTIGRLISLSLRKFI